MDRIEWKESTVTTSVSAQVGDRMVGIRPVGDAFRLTIPGFELVDAELKASSLDEAKAEALSVLKDCLVKQIAADRTALQQIEYHQSGYLLDRLDQASAGMVILPGVWERADV